MKLPPLPRHDVPVFYDPQHRRWTHVKGGALFIGVAISVVLCVLLGSILSSPALPVLERDKATVTETVPVAPPATYDRPHSLNEVKRQLLTERKRLFPIRPPLRKYRRPSGPLKAMAYLVPWDTRSYASFDKHGMELDAVIGEWLHVLPSGKLQEEDDRQWREVLEWRKTHQHETLKVLISVNNFDGKEWDGEGLARRLSVPGERAALAASLVDFVKAQGLDGLVIDFEEIPAQRMMVLGLLLNDLRVALRRSGKTVAVAVPLENDSYPYRRLAASADFVILMAYDQHWSTSEPGPVAAQDWFAESLERRINELPPERVIVALANYGYDWSRKSSDTSHRTARSLTWWDTMRLAGSLHAKVAFHEKAVNPCFTYQGKGDTSHEVWFLDAITAFNQYVLLKKSKPFGVALWRLGAEDPTVWQFFGQETVEDKVLDQLQDLPAPTQDAVEERPEVLGTITPAEPGRRTIQAASPDRPFATAQYTQLPAFMSGVQLIDDPRKLVLTFDDGPDPQWTPAILDLLKELKAPAVFFVTGSQGEEHPELLQRVVDEGHELGSHTFTHPNLDRISRSQLDLELSATQRLLESVIARRTVLFRPPYGSGDVVKEGKAGFDPLEAAVNEGYLVIGMGIDSKDYKEHDIDELVERTLRQARRHDGHFILFHDGGGDRSLTIAALPRVVAALREGGFELVSASTVLGRSRDELMPNLPARERFWASINRLAFWILGGVRKVLTILFLAGTVLGVARLLLIGVLAIFERRRAQRRRFVTQNLPSVAVIVPAFNEEKVILQTIASLLASEGPSFEIIVVDDGSRDQTFFKVMETYENHPRVKYFKKPNGGKPEALNFGISQTDAEIVVAMDADTVFTRDTIACLTRHFADQQVGAVAGNAKVGNRMNLLTRWQALEYITSQNLDRRAFSVLNCITVVPGAVGAWRRELVLQCGGFTGETLAEDADLTMAIRRLGKKIVNEEHAIALTEAPDTLRGFVRQRYRWMFGTLQAAWKHKGALFNPRYGALGFVALPNILIFQVLFPLLSPVMDLITLWSVVGAASSEVGFWSTLANPSAPLSSILFFYALFVVVDYAAATLAFALEPDEDWSLMLWLYAQRFCYRQLMYYVAIKSTLAMLRGVEVGWGKLERKGTVKPLPPQGGTPG